MDLRNKTFQKILTLYPLESAGEESDDHVNILNDILESDMTTERLENMTLV